MKFSQQTIDDLLSLPCIIEEEKSLLKIPPFIKGEEIKPFIYLHKILPGESLKAFLRRIYEHEGPYAMDCAIYGQLASDVLRGCWPGNRKEGGKISIAVGANGLASTMIWNGLIGYIGLADAETMKYVQKAHTSSKGQWCIRVGDDMYLGLASNAPLVLSMEEWVIRLRKGLATYCTGYERELMSRHDTESTLKAIIHRSLELGKLDTWVFQTDIMGTIEAEVTWSKDGVTSNQTLLLSSYASIEVKHSFGGSILNLIPHADFDGDDMIWKPDHKTSTISIDDRMNHKFETAVVIAKNTTNLLLSIQRRKPIMKSIPIPRPILITYPSIKLLHKQQKGIHLKDNKRMPRISFILKNSGVN